MFVQKEMEINMAGRLHHFIPQFFLKGFVIPDGNNKLWLYRMGTQEPIPVDRSRTAAQRDFYSSDNTVEDASLDDVITDYEQSLDLIVDDVRDQKIGEKVDGDKVGEILAHLTVRAKHLRILMDTSVNAILGVFSGENSQIDVPSLLSAKLLTDEMKKLIIERINDGGFEEILNLKQSTLVKIAHFQLREQESVLKSEIEKNINGVMESWQKTKKDSIAQAHNNALQEDITPMAHIEKYSDLIWVVESADSEGAILPDCVAIGLNRLNEWRAVSFIEKVNLIAVAFPISKDKILVGRLKNIAPIDLDRFNIRAAKASNESFWAHKNTESLTTLIFEIGSESEVLIDDVIESASYDFQKKYSTAKIDSSNSLNIENEKTGLSKQSSYSFNYGVSFVGEITPEELQLIANACEKIIINFSKLYPIDLLDRITFSTSFMLTLNDIAEGEGLTEIPVTLNASQETIIAKYLVIKRDELIKWHLVVQGEVGDFLISDDDKNKFSGTVIIYEMLAMLALEQLIYRSFPEAFLKPLPDQYENALYGQVSNVLSAYFVANTFAHLHDRSSEELVETLEKSLLNLLDVVLESRKVYFEDKNIDKLYSTMLNTISHFMTVCAQTMGHVDRQIENVSYTVGFAELLIEHNLVNWFILFNKDVAELFKKVGKWETFTEFLVLNRHLERLLFAFGIVPETQENGELHIYVR